MAHTRKTLISDLKKILPKACILSNQEEITPYECDGLSIYRATPLLVLIPDTTAQIQQIMKYCHQHEIPVVARGAGTGLSGGATPLEDGIVLSLAKFNRIIGIDEHACTATVQPGVRNLAISEAVHAYDLYYAPDPSSQIACSIGGNVAENSGGVHCLKYGLTVHNILEVKIISAEGEFITLGSKALDTPGYDLLALITGSEGLLGIIVEITVKLLPIPTNIHVLLAAFNNIEKAANAVSEIIAAGIIPAGLEMMDKLAIQAAEDFVHAGYPTDAEAMLLCEVDGSEQETNSQIEKISEIFNQHQAISIRFASSEAERANLWKGRKAAFPAVGRIAPDYYCMDGTIPRRHLAFILKRMKELSEHYQLQVANVFHAGDGNLHPLILYDANKPGELERTEEFGGKILELCIEVGGTITGEHGVGIEKINQMCIQFGSHELTQFHAIKTAFDEKGILNPGKAVPTLHRCAEFGRMHVHNGELAFPDIERF